MHFNLLLLFSITTHFFVIAEETHSTLTVRQAHDALTAFTESHPDHPELPRISGIIGSLREHIAENPDAYFKPDIPEDIHTLIGTVRKSNTIFKKSIPVLIMGFTLFICYKFTRSFMNTSQESRQINAVGQQADAVSKKLDGMQPLLQEFTSSNQELQRSVRECATTVRSAADSQTLAILAEHDQHIITLRDTLVSIIDKCEKVLAENQKIWRILKLISVTLDLPERPESSGCCIPRSRA